MSGEMSNPAAGNVGIVIVSHSPDVARGTAEMVRQMVGEEVPLAFCGGNPDGGLGTSVEAILAAIDRAWSEAGVAILVDLGGAETNSEMAIEMQPDERAGRIVDLSDVVAEVGRDVVRFIMLTRKNDAPLDFDLAKVTEQSKDNPVFYVQYAHARICSVFRNAREEGLAALLDEVRGARLELLSDPAELALLREMASYPRTLEGAATHFEPHRIAFYLHELAGAFHALWTRGKEEPSLRFLLLDEPELTRARLAMLTAVRQVIANGLGIMGVRPVEELH